MILSTLLGSLLLGMFIPFFKVKKKSSVEFMNWSLGVDCCSYYSKPFAVSNHCVTIIGFQEILVKEKAIRYSLVKKNWWGKRSVYGQVHIINPDFFQITFNHIPIGEHYQLEIFNSFNMACGQFKVIDDSQMGTDPISHSCYEGPK
jgi:hypothetical protein